MQEFSSVTASSYDAESLTPLLNEKSAEGWSVVSIVAAGTNIVAYLSRGEAAADSSVSFDAGDAGTAADAGMSTASGDSESTSDVAESVDEVTEAADEAVEEAASSPTLPDADDAPYVPADAAIVAEASMPEAVDTAESDTAESDTTAADAAAAVDEPAGWAAAPDNDLADLAAQVGADDAAAQSGTELTGDFSAANDDALGSIGEATDSGADTMAGEADSVGSAATDATDDASSTMGGYVDQTTDAMSDTTTDTTTDAVSGAAAHAGAVGGDVAAQTSADVVAETPAPAAAESTVPAGWYADPSGRYELRYWDGGAWTEHVSRAGQQFTDPPVA